MKVDLPLLTFCHILTLCIVASIQFNDEDPFRMKSVNAVWRKGQRMLKGNRLSDLYADLVVQDKREVELKRRKAENMDFDGLFEAEIRDEMAMILEKYELTHHFSSEVYGGRRPDRRRPEHDIKDKKLQKIISKAVKEGFSVEEINLLKQELGHHQQKIDEFENLKQEYDELHGKIDNSLDNLDGQEETFTSLNKKRQDMKDKHREVRESLKTVEGRIKNKPSNGDPGQGAEFEDARVYHLWALAKKAGMNEQELNSLKTELGHFESRVRKAEYLDDQVKKMDLKLQQGHDVNSKEHESLKDKAQFHGRKVEKYHDDLKKRIERRIDL